jgi:putative FmdB family regulatory protein
MPLFDFQCQKCSHTFEFNRPFGSKKVPPCPECGSKKTEKLISPPAIHFKGSGFYKTDSASKPVAKTKEKTPAATDDAKTAETKIADVKPTEPPAQKKTESKKEKAS